MAATHRRAVDLARDGQIESATWNPTTGCDRVSSGCDHCYALTLAKRLKAMGSPGYQHDGDPRTSGPGFRLAVHPHRLDIPLHWRRPQLVFVDSMSDLFHPKVPDSFLTAVLDTMREADWHRFFVLTKRPERMASALSRLQPRPLPNVWWGVTIESNASVARADRLRATPAAVRFLSLQPLLGPVPDLGLTGLDWVYVGGESGPGHRPMDPAWVRAIRDRCVDTGIPFLFKQWGGRTRNAGGRVLDGRTWDEMPRRR
ncbi:MAG TPA: phage Gp37/Gp68 family protein [Amycolatopsis sp.]|nr:phage Gp37/Gp68 family protein [Amycolatopsis sp.]